MYAAAGGIIQSWSHLGMCTLQPGGTIQSSDLTESRRSPHSTHSTRMPGIPRNHVALLTTLTLLVCLGAHGSASLPSLYPLYSHAWDLTEKRCS